MRFPEWVDACTDDTERARNRLQYIVARAAIEVTGKNSVRALARKAGIDHSVISYSIRRGQFSAEAAVKLEDFAGRNLLPHEWLRNPLQIRVREVA